MCMFHIGTVSLAFLSLSAVRLAWLSPLPRICTWQHTGSAPSPQGRKEQRQSPGPRRPDRASFCRPLPAPGPCVQRDARRIRRPARSDPARIASQPRTRTPCRRRQSASDPSSESACQCQCPGFSCPGPAVVCRQQAGCLGRAPGPASWPGIRGFPGRA